MIVFKSLKKYVPALIKDREMARRVSDGNYGGVGVGQLGCGTEILQTHPLIISSVYTQTLYYN